MDTSSKGDYPGGTLELLQQTHATGYNIYTKSGLMVGLKENFDAEIRSVMQDLQTRVRYSHTWAIPPA